MLQGRWLRASRLIFGATAATSLTGAVAMSSSPPTEVRFGGVGSGQVVHATRASVALGGLAPILPGHSIVIPKRAVGQLKDLTEEEVTTL
jgi:hypothetical protein